ncbi:hypothetical protein FQN53_007086 [Emmonsiellopsis sp. PD_33]|nr:hypothetical protein FQN53_007086 [Emmonsiellopsis sp. PD_33]
MSTTTTSNAHPSQPKRKVPLEVLHLSMPRTGSVSMMAAYQRLGLTTYHGFDFVERESDQVEWEKAIDAKWYGKGTPFKREDFDAFLGEFGVISDFPAIGFSEEFIEMYPEAKVILVDRDIDKWFHSFNTQIISAVYTRTVQFMLHYVEPFIKTRTVTTMLKMEQGMFNFSNRAEFENNARDTYRKHYANEWGLVLFPSPLQSNLDYVYTIDVDAGTLTITRWESVEGLPQPFPRQIQLSRLNESQEVILDSLDRATAEISEREDETEAISAVTLNEFDIQPGPPTALNGLQFRLFLDFCFVWRSFIDDPSTWQCHSAASHTFAIGLLRIAAWDLEVSSDTQIDYPINGVNFPRWEAPQAGFFWFHGYLIMLHRTIDTEVSISAAISKAQLFLGIHKHATTHLIILSFRHVAFVELSSKSVLCTRVLPLITNTSTLQCSPGFRLLSSVLTSYCWKPSLAQRERLRVNIPPEILDLVLGFCSPRDALALSKASFIFQERYYYSTIPQLPELTLLNFKASITCCGKNDRAHRNFTLCPCCYACTHRECAASLKPRQPLADSQGICSDCKDGKLCTELVPGGICHASRRYPGIGCEVLVAGVPQVLRLRLSKPSHLRPELKLLGNIATTIPSNSIRFTIRFNGAFSGLAYGLDDP